MFFVSVYAEELNILELNRYEFDGDNSYSTNTLKIDDNTMLVAYGSNDNGAFIKTFEITSYGSITEKSSMQYDPATNTRVYENRMIKIDSDTFALVYTSIAPPDNDYEANLKVFDILADGTVIEVDSIVFVPEVVDQSISYVSIESVDEDTFVIAWQKRINPDTNYYPFLKTVNISATGQITEILDHPLQTGAIHHNQLLKMPGGIFVLAYSGDTAEGFLKTFDISTDGTIITQTSFHQMDGVNSSNFELLKVDDESFVLAYNKWVAPNSSGIIKTYKIGPDRDVLFQQELIHDDVGGSNNSLELLAPGVIALHYFASQPEGEKMKLFEIDTNLNIVETNVLPYGIGNPNHYSQNNSLEQMNGPLLAVAHDHRNPDGDRVGSVQTFAIENLPIETNTDGDIQIQLDNISSQISSLTDLISQNIADITDLQTQIDDLSTQGEDPPEDPPITPMTYYITNGTANLYMCIPVE